MGHLGRPVETQGQSGDDEDDGGGSDLDEEPGGDQRQAAVLPVEAVVIRVECKVVKIEEPERQRHINRERGAACERVK